MRSHNLQCYGKMKATAEFSASNRSGNTFLWNFLTLVVMDYQGLIEVERNSEFSKSENVSVCAATTCNATAKWRSQLYSAHQIGPEISLY